MTDDIVTFVNKCISSYAIMRIKYVQERDYLIIISHNRFETVTSDKYL